MVLHLSSLNPHGMRNFPGSPNFSGFWTEEGGGTLIVYSARSGSVYVSSTHSSSSRLMDLGGLGMVGPSVTSPLRVVMALSSPFGLAMVLPGRDLDPKVEAVFICKRLAIMFLILLVCKPIASPVNACDNHSSSEIAKLTHIVNQQTSAMTTAMTAMLKQLQSNPPPAQVKVVEEICVTCGGAHPYYQCLAAGGNTFLEFRDNIQGYVSAATGNYNQGNPGYRPQGVANWMRPP
nr:hypothetical protein [Tanacetum cinerariifolium]